MEEEMKFIDYIKPPMENGTYYIRATQSVTLPENCRFEDNAQFFIAGHAFRLPQEGVFSTYPADNETGEFQNILPFVVMENRTFPWENSFCPQRNGVPVPWVALLVVSEQEGAEERELQIGELLEKREEGIYYPEKEKLPEVFAEKKTDTCRVLDIPKELYESIMPSLDDLPYLCHARRVNLSKTEDSVCAKDGFFSVICGNRFIPSGDGEPLKSTIHLVSLLGMEDLSALPDCKKVRLVSLYHWNVFSQKNSGEDFGMAIKRLKENCSVIHASMDTDLKRQGCSIKKHFTRTGEQTYSLYRPPLIPYANTEEMEAENRHTADGRLIYDRETGIFDVTYAAAWQLGRMLALNHPVTAESILQFRKKQKLERHHSCLRSSVDFQKLDIEHLTVLLAGTNSLKEGGCDEADTDDTNDGRAVESVFRGYR